MNAPAWQLTTRRRVVWHAVKVAVHVALRGVRNAWPGAPRRHAASTALANAPVCAEHRSPLWTDGRPDEAVLVASKVHNLRRACLAFDSVVVPAGATLSFWRQLGRPARSRGFVVDREILGGCCGPRLTLHPWSPRRGVIHLMTGPRRS